MLASILSNLKKFREQIYHIIQWRPDACMELLDALCSNVTADSVVEQQFPLSGQTLIDTDKIILSHP